MEIFGKQISESNLYFLINEIKQKKELNYFSDISIRKLIEFYLKRNKDYLKLITENEFDKRIPKKKIFKELVKDVRKDARRIYGVYITKDYSKRDELLQKLFESNFSKDAFNNLLNIHLSSRERLPFFNKIYSILVEKLRVPTSILDLGCGFNPFSIKYLEENNINLSKLNYFAGDISEYDIDFVNNFFIEAESNKIIGSKSKAFRIDLSEREEFGKLSSFETDWCFLFKCLDPIEEISENISYDLIDSIKSKYIVVSFPTLTVSNKAMRNPRRNWFEKLLDRKELRFEIFEVENELFYLIYNC